MLVRVSPQYLSEEWAAGRKNDLKGNKSEVQSHFFLSAIFAHDLKNRPDLLVE
jgi:hypothetical protein